DPARFLVYATARQRTLDGKSRLIEEIGQVVDHDVGTELGKGSALADAIDADDKTETSSAAGLNTGQGIFEHRRLRRHYVQRTSRGEVRVRSRFSLQTVPLGDESVDARFEIIDDAGRNEYGVGVCARGHDCATQTCGACRP